MLFLLVLSTLMIPTQAIMIPQFRVVSALGLYGTFWAVILPSAATALGIFLARQFMLSVPDELLEAARVDGAGNLRIFLRIVLPLSKPLIAVMVLLAFMGQWNDFLWPLITLKDPDLYTLPVALRFLQGQFDDDYGGLMAMALMASLPLRRAVPGPAAVLRRGTDAVRPQVSRRPRLARGQVGDDHLGEVLLGADPLDRVELALEPLGVGLLVADHLLEDRGGAVVAERVALLGAGVELGDGGDLALVGEAPASPRPSPRR